jgi:twinkle protein
LGRYDDGHAYCFGCGHFEKGDTVITEETTEAAGDTRFLQFTVAGLNKRGISEETCQKWKYGVGSYQGSPVQIANYYKNSGVLVAQKLRFPDKSFRIIGNSELMGLYGAHLWKDGGKRVVITEGEIDALSVSQITNNSWPVVSVPNGALSAAKYVRKEIDWLEKFETVVFCFDSDEPGQKAANECAMLLSPGKAQIASLPMKDANEMLVAGKVKELSNAIWQARSFRPDGVVLGEELWDMVSTEDQSPSVQYPWKGLNDKLLGIRAGELVTLCSGTGIGKSSICRELAYHLVAKGSKIGYIALEESVKRSAQGIMAVHMGCPPFKWAEEKVSVSRMKDAFESTLGTGRVVLYDHWGSCESENLIAQIRYMAKAAGCTHIFLDHLSIVVSGLADGDERRIIDNTMTKLRSLVEETGVAMFLVSHLKRPEGRGHEEGAQTSLSHLRGSHAISQLSDAVIGLERDQQDRESANFTTMRVLKNRYTGDTGVACRLEYDKKTGRLSETTLPDEFDFGGDE